MKDIKLCKNLENEMKKIENFSDFKRKLKKKLLNKHEFCFHYTTFIFTS